MWTLRIYKSDKYCGFNGVGLGYWLSLPFYKFSVWLIKKRNRRFKNHRLAAWYHLMNFANMHHKWKNEKKIKKN